MQLVGLEFKKLKGIKDYNEYYIVERIVDAVSAIIQVLRLENLT